MSLHIKLFSFIIKIWTWRFNFNSGIAGEQMSGGGGNLPSIHKYKLL